MRIQFLIQYFVFLLIFTGCSTKQTQTFDASLSQIKLPNAKVITPVKSSFSNNEIAMKAEYLGGTNGKIYLQIINHSDSKLNLQQHFYRGHDPKM